MKDEQRDILEEILETMTDSENPEQSLDRIVGMIAGRFATEVCSVYAYNPYGNSLHLKATVGLSSESVGMIEMDVNEGLTGMVIETMAPVFIVNPSAHPRYKYYEGSGEEVYKTYLGVPLIYHRKVLGALVVQTLAEEGIQRDDIPVFQNIAGQLAATVAYTILSEERKRGEATRPSHPGEADEPEEEAALSHLRGEPVSDRVGSGHAHFTFETMDFNQVHRMKVADVSAEVNRLNQAFEAAEVQIRDVAGHARGLSDQDKAIIDAHLMFLADPSLKKKIVEKIGGKVSAEYALKQVITAYAKMFKSMDDPYLSERSADILDIGRRVLANLVGMGGDGGQAFARDTIIVASDISPVDLLAIRQPHLKGIVLAKGGRTSHTVIMARSLEIPIVIGVEGLLDHVRAGDYLIVDGVSGFVYANPSPEIRDEYTRRQEQGRLARKKLEGLRGLPAETADGVTVDLGANIGLLSDMMLARQYGADLIGLYRTEFPFLLRTSFPSEEEQVALYRRVIEKSEGRSVTIRTFDVGGDKFLSYLDYPKEDNPFLGWRSIRLSLDLEDVFRVQIRSILRASAFGNTRILFPMITSVDEIRRVTALVAEEKENLNRAGIAYDRDIKLGIMVEVPAAVPILDRLLRYADYVNIGTNDLMQYLLAVDRNNKKVAVHFNALHPAVVATVDRIVTVCNQFGKNLCICGEAAAVKESIFLFIGMGARQISMVPSAIPEAKRFIRSVRAADAEKALADCLDMEDAAEIKAYLDGCLP
ncbi:phosphoenolpyruvate--protein phosphotransferase [Desulfoluna spongiiphila]|uniref:phosphoenolpyruvate--protein phosphotransferase n=1 Tax=Desulfoluna spongiiphila TaxID=419481 RepID=UPI00125B81EC|nr:phosphoenolpyruvate--protein phosphotransferase [Desulfoluna spongiiphila]VVS91417.1 consensus disorder prediction [Desulfoluna spongiiphila]